MTLTRPEVWLQAYLAFARLGAPNGDIAEKRAEKRADSCLKAFDERFNQPPPEAQRAVLISTSDPIIQNASGETFATDQLTGKQVKMCVEHWRPKPCKYCKEQAEMQADHLAERMDRR